MSDGRRAVWLIVATVAAMGFVAELVVVEELTLTKLAVCAVALAVMTLAYFKQRGDGKTLRPVKGHGKSRGG